MATSSITRNDAAALIADEYASTVIEAATQGSTTLAAFPIVNMGTKVTHMPVLASLPEANWVGDVDNTDRKPTSKVTWDRKTLVAEELAVIIPVHENTLADASEDILTSIAKLGGQAIGKKLDQATFFGQQKPTAWSSPALYDAAVTSGFASAVESKVGNEKDVYGTALIVARELADAGFDPTSLIAKRGLRYQFANLRDTTGQFVLNNESVNGFDTYWNRNGAWDSEVVALIADPSTVRIGVRQDITVKLLDQATLGTGENQINLAEQDMVALRFVARFGYVLGNPVTPETGERKYSIGAVLPQEG